MALLALVKPLTGIAGHSLQLDVSTIWARQGRLQNHRTHFEIVTNDDG